MAKPKKRTIELANLVVLYGESGLIENFKAKFFPAIENGTVKGRGEVRSYKFFNVSVGSIDKTPVMYGQLLKFMTIEAEQNFEESTNELVESTATLPAVPSSFFLIDLTSHRMAYLGETRRCPTMRDFEYCVKRLLNRQWQHERRLYKTQLLEELGKKRATKEIKGKIEDKINEKFPIPKIRVTPLPGLKNVDTALDPFKKITQVIVKPMSRNNELSSRNKKFLRELEKQQDRIKAEKTSLNISNSAEGLKQNEVKNLIDATASGNYQVKIKGKDSHGESIDSDLDKISVKFTDVIPARETAEARAKRLMTKMRMAFDRGYVLAAETSQELLQKARKIVKDLK